MKYLAICMMALAGMTACSSDDHDDSHGGGTPTGDEPTSTPIAAITGNALFVVNGASNSISVINPANNAVAGTIALKNAQYPHHIYASHDRAKLAVAVPGMDMSGGHGHGGSHSMPGAVMILDAKTGATIVSRVLDEMNHNAIFSNDDTEVWTTQMTMDGKVLVLDAKTLQTKTSIDVGDMPAEVSFSRDGKLAFAANGMSNSVSIIDTAAKRVVKTVEVAADPVLPSLGDDGKIYVDSEEGKEVAVIDPATQAITLRYKLGFTPGMARTAPGGTELWITDGDNGKLVFNMVGQDMKMGEVATGAGAHGIAFSADGKTGYVTNQSARTVSVVDVASHKVTATIDVGEKPNGLLFL